MPIDTLPHPASGAANPVAIVQPIRQHLGSRYTYVTFGYADGGHGGPHTVNERACRAMFKRGLRPIVGGMVICPSDVT